VIEEIWLPGANPSTLGGVADQPQFATLNEYLLAHKLSVVEEEQEAGPWDFIETRGKLELPPEEEAKNEEIVEPPNPPSPLNLHFPVKQVK
jgi:hypothetical protein